MNQTLKDTIGWGIVFWLIGYILGIILYMIMPNFPFGWIIMPIGTIIMLWVLFKKIKSKSFKYYLLLAFVWTIIAIVLDYYLLVKLFKVAEYYKLDVYVYYILTFVIPFIVGFIKKK